METTIKINTDVLNADIIEGIKKMFLHKQVAIIINEEYREDEEDQTTNLEDEEEATKFIMNRPELAAELQRRIDSIENKTANLIN